MTMNINLFYNLSTAFLLEVFRLRIVKLPISKSNLPNAINKKHVKMLGKIDFEDCINGNLVVITNIDKPKMINLCLTCTKKKSHSIY